MADKKTAPSKNLADGLAKLLRIKIKDSNFLKNTIDRLTEKTDLINADTSTMLKGALQISKMDVGDIIIPRIKMTWVPHDATFEEALQTAAKSGHSRLPVLHEEKDTVTGMLMAKDMLAEIVNKPNMDIALSDILRAPMFVPESKPLNVLLQEFRSKRVHMAIVVNEYGGTAGLVTIEDIIEEIIGDIKDEHDSKDEVGSFVELIGPGRYLVDTLMPIDEFNNYFATKLDEGEYETIGGLVLDSFGRLPHANDTTNLDKMVFRVLSADKKRILKLELQMPENGDKSKGNGPS